MRHASRRKLLIHRREAHKFSLMFCVFYLCPSCVHLWTLFLATAVDAVTRDRYQRFRSERLKMPGSRGVSANSRATSSTTAKSERSNSAIISGRAAR